MTLHDQLLEAVATLDPAVDHDRSVETIPELDSIIGRVPATRHLPRGGRRGWLLAAGVATAALLLGLIGGLFTVGDPPDPATDETRPTVASTTLATTVPTTAAPAPDEPEVVVPTVPTTVPVPTVVLSLPRETDTELEYLIARSMASLFETDEIHEDSIRGHDESRNYLISVTVHPTAADAQVDLAQMVIDGRDPSAPLAETGEEQVPVPFDVLGLDAVRSVTYLYQGCGRGCPPPVQLTELWFAIDRATVAISGGLLRAPYEDVEAQQAAVIAIADRIRPIVLGALDGSLPDVEVPMTASLDSYYFRFGQGIWEDAEIMAGRTDETFWFAENLHVNGVVSGGDLRCHVNADSHLDPSSELSALVDDFDAMLYVVDGEHTLWREDLTAANEFFATADLEAWWEPIRSASQLDPSVRAIDVLAETGIAFDENDVPMGLVEFEIWQDLGIAALPPGWVPEATTTDAPVVGEFESLCSIGSPVLTDELTAAIGGQAGTHDFEHGRDVIRYDLDRDAAVRAGFIDEDDEIEVSGFVIVVDAVEPWVHALELSVGGVDEAMAGHFRMIPPYAGLLTGINLSWSFGGFNEIADVETAAHRYDTASTN